MAVMHMILVWLLAMAFAGAGLFNAIGTRSTKQDYLRWGYPAWWCHVTGALELTTTILILVPSTTSWGYVLGSAIVLAAAYTLLRRGEVAHGLPLILFGVLIAAAAITA